MLACSVLIGTTLAAVLSSHSQLTVSSVMCFSSLLHLPELCSYSGGTLFIPLVAPG